MTTTSRMVFTVSVTLAVAAGNARGQICASHPDGPDVCAKRFVFDSTQPLSDPVLDTHWEVDYSSNPGSPDVRLLIGDVRFQVWSHVHNQPTNPADIGTITVNQTTGYDYELKLRNPSGSAGAASVGSIVLTPPGSHLTRIVGESYIFGALEDELTLESAA